MSASVFVRLGQTAHLVPASAIVGNKEFWDMLKLTLAFVGLVGMLGFIGLILLEGFKIWWQSG